jgi:hypothetical protein
MLYCFHHIATSTARYTDQAVCAARFSLSAYHAAVAVADKHVISIWV